jgi:hypothetical protein
VTPPLFRDHDFIGSPIRPSCIVDGGRKAPGRDDLPARRRAKARPDVVNVAWHVSFLHFRY